MTATTAGGRTLLDMNRYQWTVLFAAWLGWGFDVFDGLLFNFVAPNCVPTLLGLPIGSAAAKAATLQWTAAPDVDRCCSAGRRAASCSVRSPTASGATRTLMLTMLLYALGTAACALAPQHLDADRASAIVASLGIGGEWAAGAAMVAEVVPEKRRVEAGALLYTSAPLGLFLATFVNFLIAGDLLARRIRRRRWRFVFLFGLIPAAVAFVVRMFVKEPERWKQAAEASTRPRIRELFTPGAPARDAERLRDGGDRAASPGGASTPSSRSCRPGLAQAPRRGAGPRSRGDAGAGRRAGRRSRRPLQPRAA